VRVSWRPGARDDLFDIYRYIVKAGAPATALAYATSIEAFANTIGELPYAGRVRDDLRAGLRVRSFKSVIVAYEISDGRVRILRILHAARDYERVLMESNPE
jgi:toxin ParE1/3/4